jgi:bacteriocin-type transport-associated protein
MRKVLFILGQLSDDDVDWMARSGQRQNIAAGTVIIHQGQRVDSLYFVLDGQMTVEVKGIGTVAKLTTGEVVGEMSLIDARPPSASVRAESACKVLALPKDVLQAKLHTDVGFAARFYKAIATFLSDRLRGTVQRLGYHGEASLDDDVELDGELDLNVLDNVHLAGQRFDRLMKALMG